MRFITQKQKEDCIQALQNSITLWTQIVEDIRYMAPEILPVSMDDIKQDALSRLMENRQLEKLPMPISWCYLCDYNEIYANTAYAECSNEICEKLCPVDWGGSLSHKGKPCPCYGPNSIYRKLLCLLGEKGTPEQKKAAIASAEVYADEILTRMYKALAETEKQEKTK